MNHVLTTYSTLWRKFSAINFVENRRCKLWVKILALLLLFYPYELDRTHRIKVSNSVPCNSLTIHIDIILFHFIYIKCIKKISHLKYVVNKFKGGKQTISLIM